MPPMTSMVALSGCDRTVGPMETNWVPEAGPALPISTSVTLDWLDDEA